MQSVEDLDGGVGRVRDGHGHASQARSSFVPRSRLPLSRRFAMLPPVTVNGEGHDACDRLLEGCDDGPK